MFLPIYERPSRGLTIAAILEYGSEDIEYEKAPISGFADQELIYVDNVKQYSYIGTVQMHYDNYYFDEGYMGEDTLQEAQHTLIKYIIGS